MFKPGLTRLVGFPLFFHAAGTAVAGVLTLVGIMKEIPALAAVGFFVLTLAMVAWIWSGRVVKGLSFGLETVPGHAFPGETVLLSLSIQNRGWLPLSWLSIILELPARLTMGSMPASRWDRDRLSWSTALAGGERLGWQRTLLCRVRGAYPLGPIRLVCGDGFGLYPREVIIPLERELVVYPRVIQASKLAPHLAALIGDVVGRRTPYVDHSWSAGVREYQPGDALNTIHWTASARGGRLLVRQFESTTSLSILLVIDTAGYAAREYQEDFELAMVVAASLADLASRAGAPFGLMAGEEWAVRVPVASGTGHLATVLEALARLEPEGSGGVGNPRFMGRQDISPGTTLLVIARSVSQNTEALLHDSERSGLAVQLLLVSSRAEVPVSWRGPFIQVRSVAEMAEGEGMAQS